MCSFDSLRIGRWFSADLRISSNLYLEQTETGFRVTEGAVHGVSASFLFVGQERICLPPGDTPSQIGVYISDPSVVNFDSTSGVVTGRKAGFSYICVYLLEDPDEYSSILIDVSEVAVFADADFKAAVLAISDIFGTSWGLYSLAVYKENVPVNVLKYIETLYIRDMGISSLDDLVYFTRLKFLDCASNNISSLDISSCLLLETLKCEGNLLTELDLSANINLRIVIASPMLSLQHCYISQQQSVSDDFGLGVLIEPEIIP
ncbi:MAG: hypothetical protein JXR63_09135 [Spirochaetales bacterium]|nr:hypothetical protein [Spirochaetales bacterium]